MSQGHGRAHREEGQTSPRGGAGRTACWAAPSPASAVSASSPASGGGATLTMRDGWAGPPARGTAPSGAGPVLRLGPPGPNSSSSQPAPGPRPPPALSLVFWKKQAQSKALVTAGPQGPGIPNTRGQRWARDTGAVPEEGRPVCLARGWVTAARPARGPGALPCGPHALSVSRLVLRALRY